MRPSPAIAGLQIKERQKKLPVMQKQRQSTQHLLNSVYK